MDKHKDKTFAYSSLKGLVEKPAKPEGEAPGAMSDPPAVVSSVTPRKKSSKAAVRDDAGDTPSLKGLVEHGINIEGEEPATMTAAPAVVAPVTPRKKSNKVAARDEAGQIPSLMSRIEFLQATIANLEAENASLRGHLDAERKELRNLASAMLDLHPGSYGSLHATEGKLESAAPSANARPLTSRSIILIIAVLTFLIVQVALLVYADGYFFAW